MFDTIWIIFNTLLGILLILGIFGMLFWLAKKNRGKFLAFLFFVLLLVHFNNSHKPDNNNQIFITGQVYSDAIRLNAFQKDNINIYYADDTFKCNSYLTGIMAGLDSYIMDFSCETPSNEQIKYILVKNKQYSLVNIPLFSKTVSYEGTAVFKNR